jgi:hypothetical protein
MSGFGRGVGAGDQFETDVLEGLRVLAGDCTRTDDSNSHNGF